MRTQYMFFIILTIIILLVFSSNAMAKPNIAGEAAILMDAETGEILWGKNERDQKSPASITKLVTALVAIEKGNLQDEVTVSQEAVNTRGSIVWLRAGETQTLENLLYAIMLNSGNDAALVIAEHIGGTVDGFVGMMNQKARDLGAYSTNFVNPNGLPDQDHYSTAYDIALIMKAALDNPVLKEIIGTKTRDWNGRDWQSQLVNLNQLLWQYEGSLGGKTGYTNEAGRCLVAAANRDGMELISVVLGSNSQRIWSDSIRILDYGYDNFHKLKLMDQGDEILQIEIAGTSVPVLSGQVVEYLTNRNSDVFPTWQIKMQNLDLPLEKGEVIGRLEFVLDGEIIESVGLVAGTNVKKPITWVDIYVKTTLLFFGLVALILLLKAIITHKKRRNIYINRVSKPKYGSPRMY
ncbi:MAG: D-alanyl-D-alanine carboxypeptidase [Clostridia bacterium]|nr:D-alanyl-D-alanine carboxypeptidase [Clostridia bacterium]